MLPLEFITWYYYHAPLQAVAIWKNLVVFPFNLFGIRYHIGTFFRPWHLIIVRFEDQSIIRKFLWNISSRAIGSILGATVRGFTIVIGLISVVVVTLIGSLIIILWLFLPAILVYALFHGLFLLI